MKSTIPFTKDILFKSKIAEITSISLEHDLKISEESVGGNFIVSGEYKTHEVCINKERFEYKLPFNVELTEEIDLDSLNFEILDFNYDIIGDDVLRINIEFEVSAQLIEKEEAADDKRVEIDVNNLFEQPEEEIINTQIDSDDILVNSQNLKPEDNSVDQLVNDNDLISLDKQSTADEEIRIPQETTLETEKIEQEDDANKRLDHQEEQTILNTINTTSDDEEFITYNVHIVRQIETLESIAKEYNTSIDIIKEYNDIDQINVGTKIIIPQNIDE